MSGTSMVALNKQRCCDKCNCSEAEWNTFFSGGAACGGYARIYKLDGYIDGDLVLDPSAGSCSSFAGRWDGTFGVGANYSWSDERCKWSSWDVTAKRIVDCEIVFAWVWFHHTSHKWEIRIIVSGNLGSKNLWSGKKLCGLEPGGLYEFELGNAIDPPSTFFVVEA